MALRKVIYVYNDIGSGAASVQHLLHFFTKFATSYRVIPIDGHEIRSGKWVNNAALLCFGGGYGTGYLNSLGNKGVEAVRNFVYNGGSYFGSGAGAFIAGSKCEFDVGGVNEKIRSDILKLFPVTSCGPAFPGFIYDSEAGSRIVELKSNLNKDPEMVKSYFNGGAIFYSDQWENTDILYKYNELELPAIIASQFGKGRGILSGVHFEFSADLMQQGNPCAHTKLNVLPGLRESHKQLDLLGRQVVSHLLT